MNIGVLKNKGQPGPSTREFVPGDSYAVSGGVVPLHHNAQFCGMVSPPQEVKQKVLHKAVWTQPGGGRSTAIPQIKMQHPYQHW